MRLLSLCLGMVLWSLCGGCGRSPAEASTLPRGWVPPGPPRLAILYPRHTIMDGAPSLMFVAPDDDGPFEIWIRVGEGQARHLRSRATSLAWPVELQPLGEGERVYWIVRGASGVSRSAAEFRGWRVAKLGWPTPTSLAEAGYPVEAWRLAARWCEPSDGAASTWASEAGVAVSPWWQLQVRPGTIPRLRWKP